MKQEPKLGLAGRLAQTFLRSKLTPLIVLASLMLGVLAVVLTPREEEPQIIVPMVDLLVAVRTLAGSVPPDSVPLTGFCPHPDSVRDVAALCG